MIIYGSKMYGKKNVVQGWGYCDSCGAYGQKTSYNARKWGHLYWIPLIPDGPRVRVVNECKKCSQGIHLPETEIPALLADLHKRLENAQSALLAGKKEFNEGGTMISCTACLSDAIDTIYSLSAEDHARQVLTTLQQNGLTYAYHIVNGEALESQGKLDEAAKSYCQAADCDPNDTRPLLLLGAVHLNNNDHEEARLIYERALELSEEKFPVLQVLITVYGALNDHAKLSETYEQCFKLITELTQDKKVVKAYKKACKNAGRQPEL
jgi:tetratricopeptide (TPR) repeat protein